MEIKRLNAKLDISTGRGYVHFTYTLPKDELRIVCGKTKKVVKKPKRNKLFEDFGKLIGKKELDNADIEIENIKAKVVLGGKEFTWEFDQFYNRVLMDDLDEDDLEDGWEDMDEPEDGDVSTIQDIIDWIEGYCESLEPYIKEEDDEDEDEDEDEEDYDEDE